MAADVADGAGVLTEGTEGDRRWILWGGGDALDGGGDGAQAGGVQPENEGAEAE